MRSRRWYSGLVTVRLFETATARQTLMLRTQNRKKGPKELHWPLRLWLQLMQIQSLRWLCSPPRRLVRAGALWVEQHTAGKPLNR
mmetsp:Transcript_34497/g.73611  ORF Transcript_34497/g.73611 Transcript_34497/m.73611 type:complete len:85 (+) Transcript_34497:514-768(+)